MVFRVARKHGDPRRGLVVAGGFIAPCALGRSGVSRRKREGDGATPAGQFHLLGVLYRADRVRRPMTRLPVYAIEKNDGWCDDPADRNYNRPVTLPFAASHERMWRDDHLYDIVVVLDHNTNPVVRGAGSAVFIHCARENFAPTEGCVALREPDLRRLLARSAPGAMIEIR